MYVNDVIVTGPLGVCVDAKLQSFRHSAEKYDVVIVQGGRGESTKNYSPFVGMCIHLRLKYYAPANNEFG